MKAKSLLKILVILLIPFSIKAQSGSYELDSLHTALKNAPNDTVKMFTLYEIGGYYAESNRDSAMLYADNAIEIAKKLNQQLQVANFLLLKAYLLQKQLNFTLSFKLCNEVLDIIQNEKNEKNAYIQKDDQFASDVRKYRLFMQCHVFHQFGNTYAGAGNNEKAIEYYKKEIQVSQELNSMLGLVTSNMNIGSLYKDMGNLDSAFIYSNRALEYSNITGRKSYAGLILDDIGEIYFAKGLLDSATYYFKKAIAVNHEQNNLAGESESNNSMATLFGKQHQPDSMLTYAFAALNIGYRLHSANAIRTSSEQVAEAWKMLGNADSALAYLTVSKRVGDSLNKARTDKLIQFQNANFEEQLRLENEASESIAYQNKIRTTALITGLGFLLILLFVFYRNNRQKQKANTILEKTLSDLKSTQSQLIQSEKMASLGELTAGIAHEIQNPLNFVNNFSEVSNELIDEMNKELEKGDIEEARTIANDIQQNLEKINHHGKRADAIVKGMLQHSRTNSGQKELTDINALCDEYLRLAYHGLRAKDKSFSAEFKTEFDNTIGKSNIIPQDIGRVLLNLINNAFYAVNERRKTEGESYKPEVLVQTKKLNGKIEISVKDNGSGIPDSIKEKIFHPFFTTKPTGSGTGLGLSLSYDIIKAHNGEIKVKSKEAEGTKFIIVLPA